MSKKLWLGLACGLLLAGCGGGSHDKGAQEGGAEINPSERVSSSQLGAPAPGSEDDLVVQAGDRVYFALNQNALTQEAKNTLDKQADWLGHYPQVNILIAGNCDDRGTQEYNLALGERRANAARDYLEAKGISPRRITTISYGKERPTVEGDTPEAWAQNRNAITSVR